MGVYFCSTHSPSYPYFALVGGIGRSYFVVDVSSFSAEIERCFLAVLSCLREIGALVFMKRALVILVEPHAPPAAPTVPFSVLCICVANGRPNAERRRGQTSGSTVRASAPVLYAPYSCILTWRYYILGSPREPAHESP